MSIGTQIKIFRKSLKKTQAEFGELLGAGRDVISNYEIGRVKPTDTFIQLLVSKYNVSEKWLRTGQGEMLQKSETTLFAAFAKRYDLTPAEQQVARYLLALSSDERQQILKHLTGLAKAIQSAQDDDAAKAAEREQKVAAYRQELEAQEKGPSASKTTGDGKKRA